ncbi:hypothetical protein SAMN05216235_0228 [Salinicoccus halodurans]|uniref:Uncharacterized protein n=1 Tax=Salinicoccus halodurans TaxID=407035 RepID=A0AA94HBW7_9STAP|nr:hypothetical protein SAMN05216235_0228 [Salinicoccus halodurans]
MFEFAPYVEEILCKPNNYNSKGEMFCGKESSRNHDRYG